MRRCGNVSAVISLWEAPGQPGEPWKLAGSFRQQKAMLQNGQEQNFPLHWLLDPFEEEDDKGYRRIPGRLITSWSPGKDVSLLGFNPPCWERSLPPLFITLFRCLGWSLLIDGGDRLEIMARQEGIRVLTGVG